MPDKRIAYNYRLKILGHPIPEKYLTDAEKVEKGIVLDTPTKEEIPELSTNQEFTILDINETEIGKRILTEEGEFVSEYFFFVVKRVDGTVTLPTEENQNEGVYIEYEDTDGVLRFSPAPTEDASEEKVEDAPTDLVEDANNEQTQETIDEISEVEKTPTADVEPLRTGTMEELGIKTEESTEAEESAEDNLPEEIATEESEAVKEEAPIEEERKVVNGRTLDTEEEIKDAIEEDALEPLETESEEKTTEVKEEVETPVVEEKVTTKVELGR